MTTRQFGHGCEVQDKAGDVGVVLRVVGETRAVFFYGQAENMLTRIHVSDLTLVSRPSQGQRLEPVTLEDIKVGDTWFGEYTKIQDQRVQLSKFVEDDNGNRKRYRLVPAEPQEPQSVAQCVKALRAVIQVELDESGRAAERLGALRDDILEYEEEG